MNFTVPIAITEAILSSSNVDENDAPAYYPTVTYGAHADDSDNRVIYEHRIYESILANNTGNQPDISPTAWLDVGPTNRYRMFDGTPISPTQRAETIEILVTPGQLISTAAVLNVAGTSVLVELIDPDDGLVYSRSRSLVDNSLITDWYQFFFSPVRPRSQVVFDDLPSYPNASLRLVVAAGGGNLALCGELLIGYQQQLGCTRRGSELGIRDYSRVQVDGFGQGTITRRGFARTAKFPVLIETPLADALLSLLAELRATPTLFVAVPGKPETVVYGLYDQFRYLAGDALYGTYDLQITSLPYTEPAPVFGGSTDTPMIVVPLAGETMPENGVIRSSEFSSTPEGDTHLHSDWQFTTDMAGTNVVHESLADTGNLTRYRVPDATFTVGETYYARVRHTGETNGASPWSTPVQFVAGAAVTVDPPAITDPAEAEVIKPDDTLLATAFATTPADGDEHTTSHWQIARDAAFTDIASESLDDPDNLSAYPVPPGDLVPLTTYYARVRYAGRLVGYGDWSPVRQFSTDEPEGQQLFDQPGNHYWTAPANVDRVSVVVVGAGGGGVGVPGDGGGGGAGGGLGWTNDVPVTPGQTYLVRVGAGGISANGADAADGGPSYLIDMATCYAFGGRGGRVSTNSIGGGYAGDGGGAGSGGSGSGVFSSGDARRFGAGGGAGGYTADAANFSTPQNTRTPASGGAAAGGLVAESGTGGYGGPGGGVGVLGEGASAQLPGRGGSGGTAGDAATGNGGQYGGGAAGADFNIPAGRRGGHGAVRIIWGPGRAFPATQTADV